MASVAQVTKAALQWLLVRDSEAELQPDEYQDCIFALNNLMLSLDAEEVALGFTEVANLGDEVTVPVGALRGVITNLAIEMAPQFKAKVHPALASAAVQSLEVMRKLGQPEMVSLYPRNLPRGSGNYGSDSYTSPFYPDQEASILAEAAGCISLESGAI